MSKETKNNNSKQSENKKLFIYGYPPGQKGYTPTQATTTSEPPKGGSGVPPKKEIINSLGYLLEAIFNSPL
jgi:hypothetical protein